MDHLEEGRLTLPDLKDPAQAEFNALQGEYKKFVERTKKKWMRNNNHPPKAWVLYELDAQERKRVHGVIRGWEEYITPVVERWWKRRGFGILWPEKSSDPCQIYRIKTMAK